MSVRKAPFPLGDGPAREAARMIGLAPEGFAELRPQLHRRGFPLPDPDTGLYDLDAVNVWRKRRHPHLFTEAKEGGLTTPLPAPDAEDFKGRLERLGRGRREDTLLRR